MTAIKKLGFSHVPAAVLIKQEGFGLVRIQNIFDAERQLYRFANGMNGPNRLG